MCPFLRPVGGKRQSRAHGHLCSASVPSLHFVVSLSEKRRVAHRETTFLLLQKDELLKKYPFYFGSSEKLLIFALGEINFQENEKIRDC